MVAAHQTTRRILRRQYHRVMMLKAIREQNQTRIK